MSRATPRKDLRNGPLSGVQNVIEDNRLKTIGGRAARGGLNAFNDGPSDLKSKAPRKGIRGRRRKAAVELGQVSLADALARQQR